MLIELEDLTRRAAALQCIADDFRRWSQCRLENGGLLGDFAAELDHMAASLLMSGLVSSNAAEPALIEPRPAATKPRLSVV